MVFSTAKVKYYRKASMFVLSLFFAKQDDLKLEIENIKVKLQHLQKLHEVAQNE